MKKKKEVPKASGGSIISNPEIGSSNENVQLLRIVLSKVETKIDFGYQATDFYDDGGWIKINPLTFIRPSGTSKKFILTNAYNIPYGPEVLQMHSTIGWRYFSLAFPPISEDVELIDLIEEEFGDKNDFNFFRIKLNEKEKINKIY
jgi:hypothetical protein